MDDDVPQTHSDGTILVDFWERKMSEWLLEEQQVKTEIRGLTGAETGESSIGRTSPSLHPA